MPDEDDLCVCFLSGPVIAWGVHGKASGQSCNPVDNPALPGDDSPTNLHSRVRLWKAARDS
jgi:hypothetical protein